MTHAADTMRTRPDAPDALASHASTVVPDVLGLRLDARRARGDERAEHGHAYVEACGACERTRDDLPSQLAS